MSLAPCVAAPCLDLEGFIEWCRDNQDDIYSLGYIGHEPSGFQHGFFSGSHAVAYDVDDLPVRCAVFIWTEPMNSKNIALFLGKLRSLLGIG